MMNSRCTSRPSLTEGLLGSRTAVGKAWAGRRGPCIIEVIRSATGEVGAAGAMALTIWSRARAGEDPGLWRGGRGDRVFSVMVGLSMYVFISTTSAWRFRVPRINPSCHLTATRRCDFDAMEIMSILFQTLG